jgi:hypothetical protein
MSMYCPGCGKEHHEDDNRLCGQCASVADRMCDGNHDAALRRFAAKCASYGRAAALAAKEVGRG